MKLPRKYADRLKTAVPDPHGRPNHILFPDTNEVLHVDEDLFLHVRGAAPAPEVPQEDEIVEIGDDGEPVDTRTENEKMLAAFAEISDEAIIERGTAAGLKLPEDGKIERPAFDQALVDLILSSGLKRRGK